MSVQIGIMSSFMLGMHDHSSNEQGGAVPLGSVSGHSKAAHDALLINAGQVDGVSLPGTPANVLSPRDVTITGSVVSNNSRNENNPERSTMNVGMILAKEIRLNEDVGNLRVHHQLHGTLGNQVRSRICVNGVPTMHGDYITTLVPYQSYEEDIVGGLNSGDLIQVYYNAFGAGETVFVRNFQLWYDRKISHIGGAELVTELPAGVPYDVTNQDP